MRNSIAVKFIAVLLCAAALVGIVGSGLSFLLLGTAGLLGSRDFSAVYREKTAYRKEFVAEEIAKNWASENLGGIDADVAGARRADAIDNFYDTDKVFYTIIGEDGTVLASTYQGQTIDEEYSRHLNSVRYEQLWLPEEVIEEEAEEPAEPEETVPPETVPPETEPVEVAAEEDTSEEAAPAEEAQEAAEESEEAAPEEAAEEAPAEDGEEAVPEEESAEAEADAGESDSEEVEEATEPAETEPVTEPPVEVTEPETEPQAEEETVPDPTEIPENVIATGFYSERLGRYVSYRFTEESGPACDITLYLAPGADLQNTEWNVLELLWAQRTHLFYVLIAGILAFAVFAVYLCCCAGHAPKSEEIKAGGLNAMPLDLYATLFFVYICLAAILIDAFGKPILTQSLMAAVYCALGLGFIGCLIFVGFCFAFVAQIKMQNHFWFFNTVIVRFIRFSWHLLIRLCRWLLSLVPVIARIFRSALLHCLNFFRRIAVWCLRKLEHFFSLLPMTWQWLLVGFAMILLLLLSLVSEAPVAVLGIAICIALVLYVSVAFGTLLKAAQKMRRGDLETQVNQKYLAGCFKDFAIELNGLAGVAMVAAKKQLKSERMKTELITNVSHDIKTPLTSIVNYVDLLQKPHTPEQEQEYLEVLARQSERMKKLIEDLIEMSKVSSGNVAVEISRMDAGEAVQQALGEFSDKLDAAGLTPVYRCTSKDVSVMADGRLVWRAMSNLLSNAVKYSMPGTRLYVDVSAAGDKVLVSLKNISRAELNVSADELLERFVRGDASRNTEGSGLGLNIAQSLMEIQKGQLQLLVDGDLFKVTLVFPRAQSPIPTIPNE